VGDVVPAGGRGVAELQHAVAGLINPSIKCSASAERLSSTLQRSPALPSMFGDGLSGTPHSRRLSPSRPGRYFSDQVAEPGRQQARRAASVGRSVNTADGGWHGLLSGRRITSGRQ
jgi:hypothetical protein